METTINQVIAKNGTMIGLNNFDNRKMQTYENIKISILNSINGNLGHKLLYGSYC
ncbi:hypothetical protein KCTC52924_01539 [Arenibacter antarcticus]